MSTHIEDTPRTGPRRGWVIGMSVGGVLLVVFGLFGWWFFHRVIQDRELRDAAAEADRLDPGWRLDELEDRRDLIPDEENSALTALAAARLVPRPVLLQKADGTGHNLDLILHELSPEVPLKESQIEELRAALKKVEAGLVLARKLADQPRGRHALRWGKEYFSTMLPHLDETRHVAALLGFDSHLRAAEGDIDGALMSALAAHNAGRSIGDEPFLVSQMFRLSCRSIALKAIERALAQGMASAAMVEKLQKALEKEDQEPILLQALRAERAGMHETLNDFEDGKFDPKTLGLKSSGAIQDGVKGVIDSQIARSSHPMALRYLTRVVELAKLPPEKQREAFAAMKKPELEYPSIIMALSEGGDAAQSAKRFLIGQARLRCAIAALAAERFRLDTGRWPKDLAELAPKYLATVPVDLMDGATLRCKKVPEGLVIYSVGIDGKDDAGDLDHSLSISKDKDIGFRLWNVDRRRQPIR